MDASVLFVFILDYDGFKISEVWSVSLEDDTLDCDWNGDSFIFEFLYVIRQWMLHAFLLDGLF